MNTTTFTLLIAAAICLLPGPAHGGLITNGGFETGDLTGWTFTADDIAERRMRAEVVTYQGSNAFRINPGNNTGRHGGEAGGTLSQLIPLEAGTFYTFSARLLVIEDIYTPGLLGNGDGGTISISIDGTPLHTFDVGRILENVTKIDSFVSHYVPTTTGNALLELRFTRGWKNSTPPSITMWTTSRSSPSPHLWR